MFAIIWRAFKYLNAETFRERPFNLKGRGGLCFFSKKIFWFPMLLKKIFWFWWRNKKIIWFRVFVLPLVSTNSPRVDMSLHSDTFSWYRVDQSLLLLLNGVCKCQFIVFVFNYPIVARTHNLPHSRLECYILPQRCGLEIVSQILSVWFYYHHIGYLLVRVVR
jgi:hypothetical protein